MQEPRMNYYEAAPKSVHALIAYSNAVAPSIDPRLREMVKLRVSQINACAICVDMHAAELTRLGVDARTLNAVPGWREAHRLFDARDRAALGWAESVNAIPQRSPSDEEFRVLREQFEPQEIAELTGAIGAIRAFNMLNVSFQMPLPEEPLPVGGR